MNVQEYGNHDYAAGAEDEWARIAARADAAIADYATRLGLIYECRTAGDHTFSGVLFEFLRAVIDEDGDA